MSQSGENIGPLKNGTIIDERYEIVGFLGEGGFATVYRARHVHIGRMLALKVLATGSKIPKSDEFEQRFLREAQTAAQIDHPNIVTIHDFGFAGPERQPYIAMELLEGHDLEDELEKNGPMALDRALKLFLSCLEALGEGHNAGIVHKDLKPSNLFIAYPGTEREMLMILDFGVASISEGNAKRLTSTGQILGTPQYLAPEYISKQIVEPAFDVYQMALILIESLTGKPVIDLDNPFQCMMAHCRAKYEVPTKLIESPLGPVLTKALSLQHTKRYANAHEFHKALKGLEFASQGALTPKEIRETGHLSVPDPSEFADLDFDQDDALAETAGYNTPAQAVKLNTIASIDEEQNSQKKLFIIIAILVILCAVGAIIWLTSSSSETQDRPDQAQNDEPEADTAAAGTAESDIDEAPDLPAIEADIVEDTELAVPDTLAELAPDTAPQDAPEAQEVQETQEAQMVTLFITSDPSGAKLFVNGELQGKTPLSYQSPLSEEPLKLSLQRRGYKEEIVEVVAAEGAVVEIKLERKRSPKSDPKDPSPKDPKDPEPKDPDSNGGVILIAP